MKLSDVTKSVLITLVITTIVCLVGVALYNTVAHPIKTPSESGETEEHIPDDTLDPADTGESDNNIETDGSVYGPDVSPEEEAELFREESGVTGVDDIADQFVMTCKGVNGTLTIGTKSEVLDGAIGLNPDYKADKPNESGKYVYLTSSDKGFISVGFDKPITPLDEGFEDVKHLYTTDHRLTYFNAAYTNKDDSGLVWLGDYDKETTEASIRMQIIDFDSYNIVDMFEIPVKKNADGKYQLDKGMRCTDISGTDLGKLLIDVAKDKIENTIGGFSLDKVTSVFVETDLDTIYFNNFTATDGYSTIVAGEIEDEDLPLSAVTVSFSNAPECLVIVYFRNQSDYYGYKFTQYGQELDELILQRENQE